MESCSLLVKGTSFLRFLKCCPITETTDRDGNIRYYEYESDSLFPLSEHKSSDPQRGMCFLPRRALEVTECEIARAYKVTASGIEPIGFIVPRKVGLTPPIKTTN